MPKYGYSASSNYLSGANKRGGPRFRDYTEPSAVDGDLKQAIMFGLSLKTFTSFAELHRRVTARLPHILAHEVTEALEKMTAYGAVVAEGETWKRNR